LSRNLAVWRAGTKARGNLIFAFQMVFSIFTPGGNPAAQISKSFKIFIDNAA